MLTRYLRQAPITAALIAVNVAVWIVTAAQAGSVQDSYYGSPLAHDWALWGPDFAAAPWQAATSAFMHMGIAHLSVNMVMLALLGREVERFLGPGLYLLSYAISVAGASAAILWADFTTPTVGASGAIFALMGILLGVSLRRGADLRAPIALVLSNVAYTFLATGVSLAGHLGGLATGVALMPFLISRRHPVRWVGAALVAAVVAAALLTPH